MISALSYIGFASPNAAEWNTFGTEVLGARLAEPGPDGSVRLRVDDSAARITIHPGDTEQLAYLGWDVGDAAGLAAAAARVEAAGVTVHDDPAIAALRQTAAITWFLDPFGFRHELSFGLAVEGPFVASRPISGFVTGEGGLGHAVLIVPDFDAASTFYADVLGFKVSDDVEAGDQAPLLPLQLAASHDPRSPPCRAWSGSITSCWRSAPSTMSGQGSTSSTNAVCRWR